MEEKREEREKGSAGGICNRDVMKSVGVPLMLAVSLFSGSS